MLEREWKCVIFLIHKVAIMIYLFKCAKIILVLIMKLYGYWPVTQILMKMIILKYLNRPVNFQILEYRG